MSRIPMMVLALALLPSAAVAQGRERGEMRTDRMMRFNAARILLDHRADLSLDDDQVVRLEALANGLDQKNQPVLHEIRSLREQNGSPRDWTPEQRDQMRTRMETLRRNAEDARDELRNIRTEEQLTIARELLRPERGHPRGRGRERRGGSLPNN